jgi:hypothetical protein
MAQTQCGFLDGPGVSARDLLVNMGPTLKVDIGFDPSYDGRSPRKLAALPMRNVWALVDTGATHCCIDSDLAMQLKLPVIDQHTYSGISGPMNVNMHLDQIYTPNLNFTFYGSFAGVNLSAGGARHSVLIGRSYLQHFTMTHDGPSGTVVLSDPP